MQRFLAEYTNAAMLSFGTLEPFTEDASQILLLRSSIRVEIVLLMLN